MPSTLSLFLIVKNEEKHLENVLRNAYLYADEIIVVDSDSTDNTKEIAARFGCKIFNFKWKDDFAKKRNFAISKCTKDYIMWLDADDVILDKDAIKIKKLLSKHDVADVYFLPYHYLYNKKGETSLVISRERIFRNSRQIYFKYPVHECLVFPRSMLTVGVDIPIFHKNINNKDLSIVQNLPVLKKALKKKEYKDSLRLWWCFAREYMYVGQPVKSVEIFKKTLTKHDDSVSEHQLSQIHYEFATQLIEIKKLEEAKNQLAKSINAYRYWREPIYLSAEIECFHNNYNAALKLLKYCTKIPMPRNGEVINKAIYNNKVIYRKMALCFYQKGNTLRTLFYFIRSL